MSNAHGLTKENLLFAFPVGLRENPSVAALGDMTAEALAARDAEIDQLSLYARIDELPEALLDILAYDYKVDWWDPNYTLDEKRRVFKDSWYVHQHMGTKAAVETAISAIYPNTRVLEWFEYGGEPYHFRLDINITNDSIDSDKQRRVLERLNFYKNLRSHNDGVTYFVEAKPAIAKAVSVAAGLTETAHVPLVLPIPAIKPTARVRIGAITALRESRTVNLDLSVPVLCSAVKARVGVLAGLEEVSSTAIDIPVPALKRAVQARTTALTGLEETFTTRIAFSPADKVLAVTAQAKARSAVASTQETAKTFINLC